MESICLQGRTLSGDDLATVRALIAQHPDWHRTALSLCLCELWDWRNAVGRLKDMAARTLLLKLQARGLIELSPPRTRIHRPSAQAPPLSELEWLHLGPTPVEGPLACLQPLDLELAQSRSSRRRAQQLLAQYHYRGFHGAVGENLQYLVKDVRGRELAVMVFGAAAWKVAARDEFIGWSIPQRQKHLAQLANQQRFLILPSVQVSHLASHLLGLATARLSADWQQRYGHPIWLVESFVEQERFAATAYQAAGWLKLGWTTGRTRQDCDRTLRSPIKSVWVQPLHPDFRHHLTAS